jgi:hypothetical protein
MVFMRGGDRWVWLVGAVNAFRGEELKGQVGVV